MDILRCNNAGKKKRVVKNLKKLSITHPEEQVGSWMKATNFKSSPPCKEKNLRSTLSQNS